MREDTEALAIGMNGVNAAYCQRRIYGKESFRDGGYGFCQ